MVIGIYITDGRKSLKAFRIWVSSPALSCRQVAFQVGQTGSKKASSKLDKALLLEQKGLKPNHLYIDRRICLPKRGIQLPKANLHYDIGTNSLHQGQKLVIAPSRDIQTY